MADNLQDAIAEVFYLWSVEMGEKMQTSLGEAGHTDAAGGGNLYQQAGIDPEIERDGTWAFRFQLDLPDYYSILNRGRGPSKLGSKPGKLRAALEGPSGWIARKGINVRAITGQKNSIKANKSLSFLIARKIHKKGFKASHWFDKVWGGDPVPDNSPAVKELEKRLAAVLGDQKFILQLIEPD